MTHLKDSSDLVRVRCINDRTNNESYHTAMDLRCPADVEHGPLYCRCGRQLIYLPSTGLEPWNESHTIRADLLSVGHVVWGLGVVTKLGRCPNQDIFATFDDGNGAQFYSDKMVPVLGRHLKSYLFVK